jgi:hypothetical protein
MSLANHRFGMIFNRLRELFAPSEKNGIHQKSESPPAHGASPLPNASPSAQSPRPKPSLDEILQDLRSHIREKVDAAFDDEEDILQSAVDYLTGEADEETRRLYAQGYLKEELDRHRAEQATWPPKTDCDRLDAAFAELDRAGIVARQNFTCCQNCGSHEIGDEIKATKEKGITPIGYTFYHMQDTEGAVNGSGLYLAYAGKTDAVAVANQIIDALRRHGLEPKWDGNLDTRIFVPIDWKRRR